MSSWPKKHKETKTPGKSCIQLTRMVRMHLCLWSFQQFNCPFTCSFWYISTLIAFTSSSCCRRPMRVSCFSWISFSSSFMASSISCFMLTWTTSSFSISYEAQAQCNREDLNNYGIFFFWFETLTELQHHLRNSAPLYLCKLSINVALIY